MSSWFSAWLPAFNVPSINLSLPSSLQGRFISFVLKKALGHLLAPGQLDLGQIESQIGSGFVQINDLELNREAINTLIQDLPITLHDGFISSAVAKIPWPNPLTSTLGFSLDSLHLTFHLRPKKKETSSNNVNLAESVVSVAESFVHDELTAQEEASLMQSIHGDTMTPDMPNLPGSLDNNNPFKASPDEADEVEQEIQEIDPSGVSLFATMIERLLARFEFDATDTKITIVHPGNMSFTIHIPKVSYRGNSNGNATGDASGSRLKHTVSISDLSITARNLRLPSPSSSVQTWTQSRPASRPSSSSSSLDEETHMMMSQSLAYLPPRASSPADSVASSLYESAISEVRASGVAHSRHTQPTAQGTEDITSPQLPKNLPTEEQLLTFGHSPVQLQLFSSPSGNGTERLNLNVSLGVVASAIQAKHIRGVLALLDEISPSQSNSPPPKSRQSSNSSAPGPDINLVGSVRSIVAILPLNSQQHTTANQDILDLSGFYDRPLVPPALHCGYFRLHIDNVQANMNRDTSVAVGKPRVGANAAASFKTEITSQITISDMSLFLVPKGSPSSGPPPEIIASPILIIDPHLPSQYSSSHRHPYNAGQCYTLPKLDIMDWTSPEHQVHAMKLSYWRTKARARRANEPGSTAEQPASPAVVISTSTLISSVGSPSTNVNVHILPLHIFLDLGALLKAQTLAFFGEILESQAHSASPPLSPETDDEDPFAHHQQRRVPGPQDDPKTSQVEFTLGIKAIRVQVRTPPPLSAQPRSGAIVLDLDDIIMSNKPPAQSHHTRFAELGSSQTEYTGQQIMVIDFRRGILACSLPGETTASSFVSIGCLGTVEDLQAGIEEAALLRPRLKVLRQHTSYGSKNTFSIDIPSVYVDISKPLLDAVQYWIDDASQLFDRTFNPNAAHNASMQSDDLEANLVGSRYFAKSRDHSVASSTVSGDQLEKLIKLVITEVFVRADMPCVSDGSNQTIFVNGSDAVISVGTRPEEINEETGIKVEIRDLGVDLKTASYTRTLFGLTSPGAVSSTNRPVLCLRFSSITLPGSSMKESIVKATLSGFTLSVHPDFAWVSDVIAFVKSPPGTFESVVPSERTRIALKVFDGSIQLFALSHPGSFVACLDDLDLRTDITGHAPESEINIGLGNLSVLLQDDLTTAPLEGVIGSSSGVSHWKQLGFAPVGELTHLLMTLKFSKDGKSTRIIVDDVGLRITLCADTADALNAFLDDFSSSLQPADEQRSEPEPESAPVVAHMTGSSSGLLGSIDDLAFKKVPEIGPAPDMIEDDLPTNPNYLDESFGAAAGLRELQDDDFDDFGDDDDLHVENYEPSDGPGVISRVGGETIRMIRPEGIEVVHDYFKTLPPESEEGTNISDDTTFSLRLRNGDVTLALYDGFDWFRTRKAIEDEAKAVRKRLTKIRQLVANGQGYNPSSEETGALLFNSVYVGLEDVDDLEPNAMLAAIDEELKDLETATQSSWQTLRPAGVEKPRSQATPKRRKLVRSKGPSMEFKFMGAKAEFDKYQPGGSLVSRTLVTVRDVEILDHIKTSTWKKFLTDLRSDSRGNIRETGSNMVRIELRTIRPVASDLSEEVRLRAKLLPLRLYVDQDAVDFLKKFFSFKNPDAPQPQEEKTPKGTYFQLAEVFPVDLKLDYKPRRVDYKALKEGKTIELMNFFHFDGAEMTLRHITLSGITGWGRMFELLNDLWTPDVKATQLADVISGVAPIRSVVNVGSGMADLVLLPIAQYRKDGRIVRGVQKGATAFMKSTAMEAIKLGSQLATGTQVILEQAEGVLGNQFNQPLTTETIGGSYPEVFMEDSDEDEIPGISKYAQQPADVKEGVQSAYRSLRKNLSSAAQTILAIPMEVYERSGNEGAVRSVIRAVPIAVLRPMIGASEAVSKTLQGLHNTLDPDVRHENEAKYKQR